MCSPTRACLMTGRYPFRYGLQTAVIPSSHTYGLPTDEWLLPQALKEAGYSTQEQFLFMISLGAFSKSNLGQIGS
jgi:arylsulfatase A-like enzyme